MKNKAITKKAYILIANNSKPWLAEKLDISRPTLNIRLIKKNWKKGELLILESL